MILCENGIEMYNGSLFLPYPPGSLFFDDDSEKPVEQNLKDFGIEIREWMAYGLI